MRQRPVVDPISAANSFAVRLRDCQRSTRLAQSSRGVLAIGASFQEGRPSHRARAAPMTRLVGRIR